MVSRRVRHKYIKLINFGAANRLEIDLNYRLENGRAFRALKWDVIK